MSTTRLPTLFVSHGTPTLVLEDVPARSFLQSLGTRFPVPGGLCISAHWNLGVPAVNAVELLEPSTISLGSRNPSPGSDIPHTGARHFPAGLPGSWMVRVSPAPPTPPGASTTGMGPHDADVP